MLLSILSFVRLVNFVYLCLFTSCSSYLLDIIIFHTLSISVWSFDFGIFSRLHEILDIDIFPGTQDFPVKVTNIHDKPVKKYNFNRINRINLKLI